MPCPYGHAFEMHYPNYSSCILCAILHSTTHSLQESCQKAVTDDERDRDSVQLLSGKSVKSTLDSACLHIGLRTPRPRRDLQFISSYPGQLSTEMVLHKGADTMIAQGQYGSCATSVHNR